MQQSMFGQQAGQQQPSNWQSAQPAAAQRVTDCSALVLDGVWPYELMQQRPETMQLAHHLHSDLRKIVDRTNEELRNLSQLNLADAEYRATEERCIRVARSMAIMRVESTVRQLGGRSILGARGMPSLTAAPVQQRRPVNDPFESTTVVSPEVIAQARIMAERFESEQVEAEQTRVVPVVSPPYRGDSPADVEQTQVFARHRVEEQSTGGDVQTADAGSVTIGHVGARPVPVEVVDAGSTPYPRPIRLDDGSQDRPMVFEPRVQRDEDFGRPDATESAGPGRHREPAQPASADDQRSERAPEGGFVQRSFDEGVPHRGWSQPLRPLAFDEPPRPNEPARGTASARPVNAIVPPTVNGHGLVNGHDAAARPRPPVQPSGPRALEQPVTLEQMVGSLARQQPSLKWLVVQRTDGSTVAMGDLMSGWIPPGITVPRGVTVLAPEQRSGQMHDWVPSVARSAKYAPGHRIERRNVPSVAGEEAFAVVAIADDLGERIAEATSGPGLPRIANTLVRAAISGSGVLPAELDVLNVVVETAVQQLLAEAPDVNADEAVSCMLMGAAAAIAAGQMQLAAYHYGWFEAITGRRGK